MGDKKLTSMDQEFHRFTFHYGGRPNTIYLSPKYNCIYYCNNPRSKQRYGIIRPPISVDEVSPFWSHMVAVYYDLRSCTEY